MIRIVHKAFAVGLAAAMPAQAAVLAELPYRLGADRRIATDVWVDGQGPFNFFLDTAASRSMVYKHLQDQLGLTQSEAELLTVYGIDNIGSVVPVKPHEIRVSTEAIRGLTLGVLPDHSDMSDGVLGLDALSRYTVLLDHDTMRLKLLQPGDDTGYRGWGSADLVPRTLKNSSIHLWTMRTSIRGTSLTTLLDMGAGMTMLNWAAAEKLGYKRTNFPIDGTPQKLRDALGTVEPVGVIRGATIWAAGRLFSDQTLIVANAAIFHYFGMDDEPAAIAGPGLLGDNSLAIDFASRRLYVAPAPPAVHAPS